MGVLKSFQGVQGTIGQPTAQVIDGSLKSNGSNNYFNRTPGSTGNRRKFTVSFWVKRSTVDYAEKFFQQRADSTGSQQVSISFKSDNSLRVLDQKSGVNELLKDTTRLFRDPSAWYHILVSVDTESHEAEDRCEIYVNGVRETVFSSSTNYDRNYDTSVNTQVRVLLGTSRPNSSATLNSYITARLSQYYLIDGQSLKPKFFGFTDPLTGTWRPKKMREGDVGLNDGTTWSSGIPGNVLSGYPATNGFDGRVDTYVYADNTSTMTWTAPKIISGEKIEIYAYAGNTHPILNVNGQSTGAVVGGTAQQNVWVDVTHLCPGGKLETIQAFGQQISGVDRSSGWSAVRVDGEILTDSALFAAFGTNGFYLPMDNEDDFEKDKSGKGNHFTQNNFSGTSIDPDVQKDSPSGAVFGGRGQTGITTTSSAPANYATLNPLSKSSNTTFTLSDGNLTLNAEDVGMEATLRASTGKFYFETKLIDHYSSGDYICSLGAGRVPEKGGSGGSGNSKYYPAFTGYSFTSGVRIGTVGSAQGIFSLGTQTLNKNTGWALGDMIGVAVDCDRKKLQIYHNGAKLGNECDLPSGESQFSFYAFAQGNAGDPSEIEVNFGQKPFKYAPPQGFLPLNSASVRPNKVVPRPDQYVGVTTYSGDDSEYRLLSFNHQPDFTWFKERGNTRSHILSDTVTGITKHLSSDGTDAQSSPSYPYVSSVDERGIVLRGGTSSGGNVNGRYYVAWTWKAGGNKNTFNVDDVGYASAAAAGLSGDITPIGSSVGTKQGFSIIKYTGNGNNSAQSIPHGLGKTPSFIITKPLEATGDLMGWRCYHQSLGATKYIQLDSSAAAGTFTDWANTSPTSQHFYVGGTNNTQPANEPKDYVAYVWSDIPSLQKFGTYEGGDNPFVELGFRPAVVIFKNADGTENWNIFDSERTPFNSMTKSIQPNSNGAEYTSEPGMDFLSNGFKLRGSVNTSNTYIYAAWAEAPAHNLFGGQSNAR